MSDHSEPVSPLKRVCDSFPKGAYKKSHPCSRAYFAAYRKAHYILNREKVLMKAKLRRAKKSKPFKPKPCSNIDDSLAGGYIYIDGM